jgi:hypothetical protein
MSDADDTRLRADLQAAADLPDRNERLLEAAAVIADALADVGLTPVVVGGLAVAFWTQDDEITNEIDVVVAYSPQATDRLRALGLEQHGRMWTTPDDRIAWEAPGSSLDPHATAREVQLLSGRMVQVLSAEDTLIYRLHDFQGTGHRVPFEQALLMLKVPSLDRARLAERVADEKLVRTLELVEQAAAEIEAGRVYESWELHELAKRS